MSDVSVEINEKIRAYFDAFFYNDRTVKSIYKRVAEGKATHRDLMKLSELSAKYLSEAIEKYYVPSALPDGILYQNIVEKSLTPNLEECYEAIADACYYIQSDLNALAGTSIKAVEPGLDTSRATVLVHQVTNKGAEGVGSNYIREQIANFMYHIIDQHMQVNAMVQKDAGLRPTITRTRGADSNRRCQFCASNVYAGEYNAPSMPSTIFQRHRGCRCSVVMSPGNGRLVGVHSQQNYKSYLEAVKGERDYLNRLDDMTPTERKLARNERARDRRKAKYTDEEWEMRLSLMNEIARSKSRS